MEFKRFRIYAVVVFCFCSIFALGSVPAMAQFFVVDNKSSEKIDFFFLGMNSPCNNQETRNIASGGYWAVQTSGGFPPCTPQKASAVFYDGTPDRLEVYITGLSLISPKCEVTDPLDGSAKSGKCITCSDKGICGKKGTTTGN